jgi:hypothetical protein
MHVRGYVYIRYSEVTVWWSKCTTWEERTSMPSVRLNIPPLTVRPSLQPFSHRCRVGTFRVFLWRTAKVSSALLWGSEGCWWGSEWCCWCRVIGGCWWWAITCPKNKADFQKYRGGSPLEGKFPGNSRKLGIISSDYWEIYPPEDFLCYTLGNLLCFQDSV